METWAAAVRGSAQTDSVGHDDEPAAYGEIVQSSTAFGNKETRGVGVGAEPVSSTSVGPKFVSGGEVDGNQSGLAEFGLTHGDEPLVKVDIMAVQSDCLT